MPEYSFLIFDILQKPFKRGAVKCTFAASYQPVTVHYSPTVRIAYTVREKFLELFFDICWFGGGKADKFTHLYHLLVVYIFIDYPAAQAVIQF